MRAGNTGDQVRGHDQPIKDLDTRRPSVARMYDWYLGGQDNFASDREAAAEVEARLPNARLMAKENRAFLGRVVRYLAGECGIRQFVDIGSGLPTQENIHQVAQKIAPDARVVYVDNDEMVLSHGRALLAENGNTTVISADLRKPKTILDAPDLRRLIDPSQPVAVLMIAILHFITDEEHPYGLVDAYHSWTPPGSYLVISHAESTPAVEEAARVYDTANAKGAPRTKDEVREFFGGLQWSSPGSYSSPSGALKGGSPARSSCRSGAAWPASRSRRRPMPDAQAYMDQLVAELKSRDLRVAAKLPALSVRNPALPGKDMVQQLLLRDYADEGPTWCWVWPSMPSGERGAPTPPPTIEDLCPAADIAFAADRIAKVLALGDAEPVGGAGDV